MFKKKIIFIWLVFLGVTIAVYFFILQKSFSANDRYITLNGAKFSVEIADTYEKRKLGLSGRDGMCQDCGMLFKFPDKGKYNFWMKDMRFPLDIIWISQGKIVHLEKDVRSDFAGILKSENEADTVLEINAGISEKIGLKIGDKVDFQK